MTKVWRDGDTTVLESSVLEWFVLQQHCFEVLDRLGGAEPPASSDPFEEWERSLGGEADEDADEDDPVRHRLFPNAYPDDPRASADFRRYTEDDQRRAKAAEVDLVVSSIDQALLVQAGTLQELPPDLPLRIDIAPEQFESWLKALTTVRLSLAAQLGVTDAEDAEALQDMPEDDPRAILVGTMELAGVYQTLLLMAAGEVDEDDV